MIEQVSSISRYFYLLFILFFSLSFVRRKALHYSLIALNFEHAHFFFLFAISKFVLKCRAISFGFLSATNLIFNIYRISFKNLTFQTTCKLCLIISRLKSLFCIHAHILHITAFEKRFFFFFLSSIYFSLVRHLLNAV